MIRTILISCIGAISFMILIALWLSWLLPPTPPPPTPPPVINERAIIMKHEKYQMFLEQMQNTKSRVNVEKLLDSLNKYKIR